MKRFVPFVIILAVMGVAVAAGYYLTRARQASNVSPNTPLASTSPDATRRAPSSAHPGAEPPHTVGPADAPVTLEEFGDFECPPCAMLHPVLKTMEKDFGPRLRVIFREFPLIPTHAHALEAARTAEAAGLQGKFWEMHDLLYENQKTWHEAFDVRPIFEGYAARIKLDLARLKRDISSDAVARRIFLDGKRANDLGVNGTPTVFLNGREVPFESLAPEKLRALINAELAASGK